MGIFLMELNGKGVDISSLSVDGVDSRDYPDFCDAYFEYATYVDGIELDDDELEVLRDTYPEVVHSLALDGMVSMADFR